MTRLLRGADSTAEEEQRADEAREGRDRQSLICADGHTALAAHHGVLVRIWIGALALTLAGNLAHAVHSGRGCMSSPCVYQR